MTKFDNNQPSTAQQIDAKPATNRQVGKQKVKAVCMLVLEPENC